MTNSVAEFELADCILIIGSNTTSSHPIVATRILRAKRKGAKIIVADPRKVHIADLADLYVTQRLGTDVALLNGIMHVILDRGWENRAFIEERTEGFEEFEKVIRDYPPERVAKITGVAEVEIEKIAQWYATAERGSIAYCMGITQHTTGVDNVKALANLAMLTGHIGREGTGLNPLRGQNNVQGACDMGALPNVYPGYQPVSQFQLKEKFESAWGVALSDKVGLTIPEMTSGLLEGTLKALYIIGENPLLSDPDSSHVEEAIKRAELVVVQDIFFTPTAELAHVILPAACFAEKDGTVTNTERRVMRTRKAVDPPGEAKTDWEILTDLANRMGYSMNYSSAEEIMNEIASLTPSYGGITYERLEGEGIQWPCPTIDHPGTKFLHKDRFVRGKGLFHAIEFKPPAESTDEEFPFWLTTGRLYFHFHTGTMTRKSVSLTGEIDEQFVELNPEDASQLNIITGDQVLVTSRRGQIRAKALVTDRMKRGEVFVSFHFVESNANILTNPAFDPIVKIPEYKVCAVRVEKASV